MTFWSQFVALWHNSKCYNAPSNTPDPVRHKYVEPKVVEKHDWNRPAFYSNIGLYDPGFAASACSFEAGPRFNVLKETMEFYGTAQKPRIAGNITVME